MAISLERAGELVLAAAAPLTSEVVPIAEASGRVLAGELRARADSPRASNSAMDGFAVTAGAAGRTLRLIGESRAGAPSPAGVDPQTAIRIATGGVLPPGAEAVVPSERASVDGDRVTIEGPVAHGWNVRRPGEDMRAGQTILAGGTRLTGVELAAAIGAGHGELVCRRRPRVAVLGTGDELRDPGTRLAAGQIHDSNTVALAALVGDAGAAVTMRGRIADDPAAIREVLGRAFAEADLVVVSGGVSVGRHDHVKGALKGLGADQAFWGVQIRPGRPTWFGRRAEVAALGLPGNPVAAIVMFILLGRPLLAVLEGAAPRPRRERARLATAVGRHPGRTEVVRVHLRSAAGGEVTAVPSGPPGSHLTTSLIGIDGLGLVPPGLGELAAGSELEVERLWC